jgi:hypothetical protein
MQDERLSNARDARASPRNLSRNDDGPGDLTEDMET